MLQDVVDVNFVERRFGKRIRRCVQIVDNVGLRPGINVDADGALPLPVTAAEVESLRWSQGPCLRALRSLSEPRLADRSPIRCSARAGDAHLRNAGVTPQCMLSDSRF